MWPNPQESADLVTFTEKILNGKFHFLCSSNPTFWVTFLFIEPWSSNIIQVLFLNFNHRSVWKHDGFIAFEILFKNVFLLFALRKILSYLEVISFSSSCGLRTGLSKTFRFSSASRCSVYFDQQQGSIDFSSSPQYVNSSSNNGPQISDGACSFPKPILKLLKSNHAANIYLFKVNNRNTRKRSEICSKLTIKTPERRQRRRSGVFIVNFEHISHLFLVLLLLTLNM